MTVGALTYLYGIAERVPPAVAGMPGVAGAPVRRLRAGGLAAAVSAFPAGGQLATADLWAHALVVERLQDGGAVVPARFGSRLPDDATVAALVAADRDALRSALARVRGRVELAVRATPAGAGTPVAPLTPPGTGAGHRATPGHRATAAGGAAGDTAAGTAGGGARDGSARDGGTRDGSTRDGSAQGGVIQASGARDGGAVRYTAGGIASDTPGGITGGAAEDTAGDTAGGGAGDAAGTWPPGRRPDRRPGPGTAYLAERAARARAAARLRQAVHVPLMALAVEGRWSARPGGEATGAYLVDAGMVHAFAATVARLAAGPGTATLTCTGPWPPYSFAAMGPP